VADKRFTDLNLRALREKYLAGDRSTSLALQTLGVLHIRVGCDPSFTEMFRAYHHPETYLKTVFDTTTKKEGVP